VEILPDIHQVDDVNGNCYLIVRDGITVVDTGIPGSGKKILSYISERLHRKPDEVKTIIITHFHMDHTGGVAALKKAAPGARIAVGREDAAYVTGETQVPGYPGIRGLLMRIAGLVMRPARFRPDILLDDGAVIAGLMCIRIPGHTPGSIALLDQKSGTLFSGDILRYDGTSLAEGPAGFTMDLEGSRQSIRSIALLAFTTLLPGHGIPLREHAAEKVRAFAALLPSPAKELS